MIAPREPHLPADGDLLDRVLAGERDAYGILVGRYQERLFRFALASVRDRDTAADLVQDTLVRAYANLATCRDRDRFGAWLFRILRNRCIDHGKEHRRRDVSLFDRGELASTLGLPEVETERSYLRDALERALAELPEAQREAFLLKHLQGMSYEEISVVLDVGTSALKMRVARAREALQSALATLGYARDVAL